MRLVLAGFAATALLVLASACGGGGGGGDDETEVASDGPAPTLPVCAAAGSAGRQPPSLPVHFPLPPGTVITSSASPHASQIVVLGAIPSDLQEAAAFFSAALPDHGYQVGIGDAEGNESEAPFTGNGYRGKWRVNEIPECPAVRLTLVLIEQS
jgi:hypothetical protein